MTYNQKMKLNDEVIDGLCSFFKGANTLIENDSEFATLYAYLLLQATGIERLQKIVFILDYYTNNGKQVTDDILRKKLGHGILNIHQSHLVNHYASEDKMYYEAALQLLSELVNVKKGHRYTNFNLHSDERFNIHDHIVQLLELEGLDYSDINDYTTASWKIMDTILKKYVAILVNLIWHKHVGNGEVMPICLQDYVVIPEKPIKPL